MSKKHLLKIQKVFFDALLSWDKKFELRKNDRDFQTWDILIFKSIPEYKVHLDEFKITHILNADQFPDWIKKWYVILSLEKLKNNPMI